ncbi:WD40 repeat domain-containing protein [Moraxella bovis]|uniref:WD40 repeat domain-containing protein n=1 Tax=Moraxella bovis TaxID=476 RepID=UPI0022272B8C|nr:hypothetical protein [Moraxella bovis]UZA18335.1 hypothetical protein LP088_08180 [Moraxella bovis]
MNQLIAYSTSNNRILTAFHLRQGLLPTFAESLPALRTRTHYSDKPKGIKVSPNGKQIIIAHLNASSTPSTKFWVSDTQNPSIQQSLTYFDGSIYALDISNSHYAVGGDRPAILLFDSKTHTALPINTLGLGRVTNLCFNRDGTKLFVSHDRDPYLRVYDMADFSYQEASTPLSPSTFPVLYVIDDKLLFFGKNAQNFNYFKVFDENLSQVFSYSDSTKNAIFSNSFIPFSPIIGLKKDTLWFLHNKKEIYELNYVSGELSKITTLNYAAFATYDIIKDEQFLYISHGLWENRNISIYNLSDFELNTKATDKFYLLNESCCDFAIVKSQISQITGIVRDINNTVASRTVRAYDRKTGELLAQTQSNTQGEYTLELPNTTSVDVQFMAQDGELLNDLFYANVTPEPV